MKIETYVLHCYDNHPLMQLGDFSLQVIQFENELTIVNGWVFLDTDEFKDFLTEERKNIGVHYAEKTGEVTPHGFQKKAIVRELIEGYEKWLEAEADSKNPLSLVLRKLTENTRSVTLYQKVKEVLFSLDCLKQE